MDSDSAPIEQTFEQAKQDQSSRRKQITQHLEVQKKIKKQKKDNALQTFNLKKKQKVANLFEENEGYMSSNNLSEFTIAQQQQFDQSFQRNLDEKLPQKVLKTLKLKMSVPQRASLPKIINLDEMRTVKKLGATVTVENSALIRINPRVNQQKAIDFLRKNILDKVQHKRKPIKSIVGRRVKLVK